MPVKEPPGDAVPRRTAWAGCGLCRFLGRVRDRTAGGEPGMVRLFDLHALSAAGDALIALGLAGTIFFAVPLGEARTKVALYLLVTMVPFALLAPLIGPLLDHFRHGRRYALSATMLGRAMLAWMIADFLDNFGLYPAAFGVLVLSRAYGVARAAAVPRLLPERLVLSQVNARGSVYGTAAGAIVLPLGLAAFWVGPQWPLRAASAIFLVGMVVALQLPPRADSDPPESLPRLLQFTWLRQARNGDRVLSGRLVVAALVGGAVNRGLYGFLLLFLAFAIRAGDLPTGFIRLELGEGATIGLISGTLVTGTFLAVAVGARMRIRAPLTIQASGLLAVAVTAAAAALWYTLPLIGLLCLVTAISSGLAKLAVDSSIQEKLNERLRATAFSRSETLLMLAFVAGGAFGLIPMPGRLGIATTGGLVLLALIRAGWVAVSLRHDRLCGRPALDQSPRAERRTETDQPPRAEQAAGG